MPERSCLDCQFYRADQCLCDVNYRATCILNEVKSAKDCTYYKQGTFIDSDEHLLVDDDAS